MPEVLTLSCAAYSMRRLEVERGGEGDVFLHMLRGDEPGRLCVVLARPDAEHLRDWLTAHLAETSGA